MFPIRRKAFEEIHMTNCLYEEKEEEKKRENGKQFSLFVFFRGRKWKFNSISCIDRGDAGGIRHLHHKFQGFRVWPCKQRVSATISHRVLWNIQSAPVLATNRFYVLCRVVSFVRTCTRYRIPIDWHIFSYNINLHVIALEHLLRLSLCYCCTVVHRWGAFRAVRQMPSLPHPNK